MNTETPALELEVLPDEVAAVSTELSAPKATALAAFTPFQELFAASALLLAKEKSVNTPKEARELRLEMRKHRSACKQTKDTVKSDILLAGRIADAYFNRVTGPLENAEARLDEIEKAEERRIAAERETRRLARIAELAAVGMDGAHFPLGEMLDAPYAQLLAGAKLAHEAKFAEAEKARVAAEKAEQERQAALAAAEAARVKKEAEDAAEREHIAAENAKLKAERDAAEAAAKAEREKAAEAARLAAAERAEAEKKAAAELKAAQDKARKEREAAEAKARAEREEAAKLAEIERKKAVEAARVEREKREELERAEQARIDAAVKAKREEEAAAARAAAAPDKEKLAAIGVHLNAIQWPEMATEEGGVALRRIKGEHSTLVHKIREEYKSLGR